MKITYPAYYESFSCIAASCPDSCCKEWTVDVDEEAAKRYRALPGELGDRLRAVLLDTEEGTVMQIREGRCPMWRQDGLCRIHAALGHDALCKTCREFPRLRHDYGSFRELGLELSCPEAARLIFHGDDSILSAQEETAEEAPDEQVMDILLSSRQTALDIIDRYPLPQALALLLLYGYSVQNQIDGGAPAEFDPEKDLALAKQYATEGDIPGFIDFFKGLELLTSRWKARLDAPLAAPCWDKRLKRLAKYMLRRYYLQAVCDYDLVCRVKFTVAACLLVALLGGDPVETAQLFSKEIENDQDNVEAILDGAYTAPGLTDGNLLALTVKP